MILKKFIGKTLDAAKRSARQMYGDDVLVLDTSGGDGQAEAGITVAVNDESPRRKKQRQEAASGTPGTAFKPRGAQNGGVRFAPSGGRNEDREAAPRSPGLLALRKYAQEQARVKAEVEVEVEVKAGKTAFQPREERGNDQNLKKEPAAENMADAGAKAEKKTGFSPRKTAAAKSGKLYSRSSVRRARKAASHGKATVIPADGKAGTPGDDVSFPLPDKKGGDRAQKNGAFIPSNGHRAPAAPGAATVSGAGLAALAERLDRVEALLKAGQAATNYDYVTHPAFRQLLQTGMDAPTVMAWFSEIVSRGIDPRDNADLFMARLSATIREAVGNKPGADLRKFVLFTGLSGSGKTSLAMKLSRHPDLMGEKKVAVAAVYPPGEAAEGYYSVLEPYCADHDIPFAALRRAADVSDRLEAWAGFDHVLIDTPPLPADPARATEAFLRTRQLLAPLAPLEVHYVVNASLHRYKRPDGTLRKPAVEADYLAFTHLDEAVHWGPLIPYRRKAGRDARFISPGPGRLELFDPIWFVQKILQDTQAL